MKAAAERDDRFAPVVWRESLIALDRFAPLFPKNTVSTPRGVIVGAARPNAIA